MEPQVDFILGGETLHKAVVQCVFKRRIFIKQEQDIFLAVDYIITFTGCGVYNSPLFQIDWMPLKPYRGKPYNRGSTD